MCVRIAPWILTWTTFVVAGPTLYVQAEEETPSRSVLQEAVAPRLRVTRDDTDVSSDPDAERTEVIRQRHANRSVKIERTVIRDNEDNYVNHGPWRMWDSDGNMVAEGEYRQGQRHGVWTSWHLRHESKLLSQRPYSDYKGPFVSQADFKNGKLHGVWTIVDGQKRTISEWEYRDGVRHGKCIGWYASGNKMQEIDFKNGEIHGSVQQWSEDGDQTTDDLYQQGRRLGRKTEQYGDNQKKSEGDYLFAPRVLDGEDDWWNLQLAAYTKRGEDMKHGDWKAWFPNGQLKVRGQYALGKPIDDYRWTWWHSNGQKAAEGIYKAGQQKGRWTWWHANGQKQLEGNFQDGEHEGLWIWWAKEGKVAHKEDYRAHDGQDALPASPEELKSREVVAPETIVESGERSSVLTFPKTAKSQDRDTLRK